MMRNKTIVLCLAGALVVALVVICFLVYRSGGTPSGNSHRRVESNKPQEQVRRQPPPEPRPSAVQPPQGTHAKPAVVLFYAEWCGHSKNMMPAWEEASQTLRSYGTVDVIDLEHGRNKDEIQKHNVQGFPTIRLYPEGFPSQNFVEYQGDRSADSIVKFVSSGGQQT